MYKYFKGKYKPKVQRFCAEIYEAPQNPNIDGCPWETEWYFYLPCGLDKEIIDKFGIPKYIKVNDYHGNDEILFLNYNSIFFIYKINSYDESWGDNENFLPEDFRTTLDHNSEETLILEWFYGYLDDYGTIEDRWDFGYEDCDYKSLNHIDKNNQRKIIFDNGDPHIFIENEEKKIILEDLYKIMTNILDGNPKRRNKLYNNGSWRR